ncbi:PREDICTED: neuronal-specific septin-3 isoform X1 [Galeopterus variegatus]|uniref:Neuronal-specific septin-3 isoform X1 n=1 Tax=Galeopterus variegatus TaxID=482537 RepID=A0ABM0QVV8_GALVR|nr:PREDICTED: neuronal-specific septin-3 isoform X1 [Galeopterus variegatus]
MSKGLPETRTDAAMSELVPEPRPKPAVPMKPVSINSNLLGYIGIDTIIEQMRKKTMKTGFDFNIMVVGQSGLGKSTLVNTLFKSQVSRKASSWNREEKIPKTVEIKAIGHVIEEGGVKMKLTVIDTPGFGDQINNENCWEPIEKYINEQYEKFLKEEVNIARKKRIPDTRVHCCLYFISPTGHSLRPLDLEFMKHLSKVVNIIPVIAKADTMTLEEKSEFKQRVRKELEIHGIEFYPQKEFDEDLEDKTENDKIRQESMPFAVVGSDKEYQVNGKRVLGRKTPWGIIEVENLNHCEFALLRDFVIREKASWALSFHLCQPPPAPLPNEAISSAASPSIPLSCYCCRAKPFLVLCLSSLPPQPLSRWEGPAASLGQLLPPFTQITPLLPVEWSSRQHCPTASSLSAGPSPSIG